LAIARGTGQGRLFPLRSWFHTGVVFSPVFTRNHCFWRFLSCLFSLLFRVLLLVPVALVGWFVPLFVPILVGCWSLPSVPLPVLVGLPVAGQVVRVALLWFVGLLRVGPCQSPFSVLSFSWGFGPFFYDSWDGR
jgi:hypothetical protein